MQTQRWPVSGARCLPARRQQLARASMAFCQVLDKRLTRRILVYHNLGALHMLLNHDFTTAETTPDFQGYMEVRPHPTT